MEEMLLKHSEDLIDQLAATQNMSEEELKEMSKKYDYIYFHPVCMYVC